MARRRQRANGARGTAAATSSPSLAPSALLRLPGAPAPGPCGARSNAASLARTALAALVALFFSTLVVHFSVKHCGLLNAVIDAAFGLLPRVFCETLRSLRLPRLLLTRCGVSSAVKMACDRFVASPCRALLTGSCVFAVAVSIWLSTSRRCPPPPPPLHTVAPSPPAVPVAPSRKRGKRGGGKHVAERNKARERARVQRFDSYRSNDKVHLRQKLRNKAVETVTEFLLESDDAPSTDAFAWARDIALRAADAARAELKAEGKVSDSDADSSDNDDVHPYFRDVLSSELSGMGFFGYTDDEDDEEEDDGEPLLQPHASVA